jgi:Domain of unknown function (DUF5667)
VTESTSESPPSFPPTSSPKSKRHYLPLLLAGGLIGVFIATFMLLIGLVLALSSPLLPGSIFYPLQDIAEKARINLTLNPSQRILYLYRLDEQRAADVVTLLGTPREVVALDYLNQSLTRTIEALSLVSPEDSIELMQGLRDLAQHLDDALHRAAVSPFIANDLYKAYFLQVSKVHAMLGLVNPPIGPLAQLSAGGSVSTDPVTSQSALALGEGFHDFFPLLGVHQSFPCENCHVNGPDGTPGSCLGCHETTRPVDHFAGNCATCHATSSWMDVQIDHAAAGLTDCVSCHEQLRPANHFDGQCSTCHTTESWSGAVFDHQLAGATDCISCHLSMRPANHFDLQCSTCHSPSGWLPVNFDHQAAGAGDCQSCHEQTRPANHYPGQCSQCHTPGSWLPANFNHSGFTDCQSCHAQNRPTNHYSGQCSQCHTPGSWLPAHFNHSGYTDCQSCHEKNRPANHYPGQCSKCHTPSGWRPANFDHSGFPDCQSCHEKNRPANHFSGQCSNCHKPGAWLPAHFNHDANADCQQCHTRPANHWQGQCQKCHDPSGWKNISVDGHSFPMNHGNANGRCSSCHTGTNPTVNCFTCHNRSELEKKHAEEGIANIAGRCIQCHPNGKGGD